jgi:hypothetical protein
MIDYRARSDYTRAALPHFEELGRVRPLHAARNLSMLTFGNATAARRASYRILHTDDIEFYPQGMRVTLRETKTRQDAGDVHIVEVRRIRDERICPVINLLHYIEMARLEPGYIYRGVTAAVD